MYICMFELYIHLKVYSRIVTLCHKAAGHELLHIFKSATPQTTNCLTT